MWSSHRNRSPDFSLMTQKLDSLTSKFLTNPVEITPKMWIALGTPLSEVFNLLLFPPSPVLHNYQFLPGLTLGAKHLVPDKIQLWVWGQFSQRRESMTGCTTHNSFSPIQSFSSIQAAFSPLEISVHPHAKHQDVQHVARFALPPLRMLLAGCGEHISPAWTFVCACPVLKSVALTRHRAGKASCLLCENPACKWEPWKKNRLQHIIEADNADGNWAAQLGHFSSLKVTKANVNAKKVCVVPSLQWHQ